MGRGREDKKQGYSKKGRPGDSRRSSDSRVASLADGEPQQVLESRSDGTRKNYSGNRVSALGLTDNEGQAQTSCRGKGEEIGAEGADCR